MMPTCPNCGAIYLGRTSACLEGLPPEGLYRCLECRMLWTQEQLFDLPTWGELQKQPGFAAEQCSTLEEITLSYPKVD